MLKINEFTKIRLQLSAIYFLIIFFIVGLFSSIVLVNQFNQIDRFNKIRFNPIEISSFQNPYRDRLIQEKYEIEKTISDVKFDILTNTLTIDVVIILMALLLSYYISGETMKPIIVNLDKQKKFVADASHELKTPLTSIKTEAEVLLRGKKVIMEDYKDFTKSVIEEVDRLTELTTDLLTIAKYDNIVEITTNTELEKVNLKELLDNIIKRFEKICESKSLNFEFNNQESYFVKTDPKKLTRLISIIIDNAIKYNKENGNIIINLKSENDKFILTISDNGIGIDKHHLSKIFDRFYRVSDDRNKKGFGLGLSIAKQISKELNTLISIESEIDVGTKVTIEIPISNNFKESSTIT